MTHPRDPVTTAQGLTAALTAMEARLGEAIRAAKTASEERDEILTKYGRRNRKFVVVDIALTVLLTVFGYLSVHADSQARNATDQAAAQHASLISACRAGNQQRAEQIMLWTHLAAVSKPRPGASKKEIAKDKAQVATLIAYVRHTFAPRDCVSIYATSKPRKP